MSQDITVELLTHEALEELREKKYKPTRKRKPEKIRADVFEAVMATHQWEISPAFNLLPESKLLMQAVDAAWEIYAQELQNKQD